MNNLTWDDVHRLIDKLPAKGCFWGIPRGGAIVAQLTRRWSADAEGADYILDDIYDSGATYRRYKKLYPKKQFHVLLDKRTLKNPKEWVVFPWERQDEHAGPEDAIIRLLQYIGEDPNREGLLETPKRVLKAWKEMTAGNSIDAKAILAKEFNIQDVDGMKQKYDQIILSGGIPFASNCEHHMMPFHGHAYIGYMPSKKGTVVGLSKLARVVDAYGQRLQVQERMTQQIANVVDDVLKPRGTAVIIKARHTCQCHRGVKKDGYMVTSAMYGVFRKNETKKELFALMNL